MTFLEIRQYFGTSQDGINDKKNGTEGVRICNITLIIEANQ